MKGFYLYYIVSLLTGSPLVVIAAAVILYLIVDRYYLGFLSGLGGIFKRNSQIRANLKEICLNPQNAKAAYALGMLYFEMHRFNDAYKFLEHSKLKDETTPGYLSCLGMTLMELGREDEGKDYILKAVDKDPRTGYGLPYIYLLQHEIKAENPDKNIIDSLEQKIERFANTENLYRMGMVYKKLNSKEKANAFFTKALAEYSYCPRGIRRLHRKWAILSGIQKWVK